MKLDIIRKVFSKGREIEEKKSFLFQSSTVIETPEYLFGRSEELQTLCGYAEGLHQVQIIGARRFGKTCLAKSFVTLVKNNKKRNVNPVFVDIYSDEVSGTANVYRYLSALVISNLLNDGFISDDTIKIFGYLVTPHADWKIVFKLLRNIEDCDARCLFDEIVEKSNKKTGKTLLLIFDEYEKSTEAFDNVNGFRHIRNLSEKSLLKFWIVGATPWDMLVMADDKADYRASHVFNGVQYDVYVCPLELDDFKKMWYYECSLIPDDSIRQKFESLCEKVFESSGGVPCFAKEIGARTYIEEAYPEYDCLSKHFSEMEKMLLEEETNTLRELLYVPKEYDPFIIPKSIKVLEKYGLIKKDDQNKYIISIHFFSDYLHARLLDKQQASSDNISIDSIVDKIDETIYQINDKWNALYGKFMFDPGIDMGRHYRDLRKKCDCREKAPNFINSIYLIYWEGAKENKEGDKIPFYFKITMFRKAMDRIRHIIGKAHQQDKLQTFDGQIDKPTALKEIWGKTTEPQTPNEWLFFQERMLIRFLQELTDIYDSIGKELCEGEEYEGIIIEKTGTYGKIYKKVLCKYYPYPLKLKDSNLSLLSGGDEVKFIAKEQQDINNPSRNYWMAYNIRKK